MAQFPTKEGLRTLYNKIGCDALVWYAWRNALRALPALGTPQLQNMWGDATVRRLYTVCRASLVLAQWMDAPRATALRCAAIIAADAATDAAADTAATRLALTATDTASDTYAAVIVDTQAAALAYKYDDPRFIAACVADNAASAAHAAAYAAYDIISAVNGSVTAARLAARLASYVEVSGDDYYNASDCGNSTAAYIAYGATSSDAAAAATSDFIAYTYDYGIAATATYCYGVANSAAHSTRIYESDASDVFNMLPLLLIIPYSVTNNAV